MLQRFVVTPNEQVRETPFIQHNIAATRRAFALDGVEERELSGDAHADARRHRAQRRHARATCGCGITSRCSTRSARSRRSAPTTTSSSVDNDRYMINGEYRQIMLSARELNSEQPAEPHLDQRAADVHARLRPDARPGQPGDRRRAAGAVRREPAARDDRRNCRSTEPSIYLRRAVERLRDRRDEHAGVPLSAGRRQRLQPVRRQRRRADRHRCWRKLLFALRFGAYQILLSDDITAGEPGHVPPQHPGARPDDRAVPDLRPATRTWSSPTAGCSGSRTPTRRAPAIRTRRRPAAASTTSATR